jgi:prevent-host-death family protein
MTNLEAAVDETVSIHVAKTNLSKLVARAEAGEEIIIARGRKPVAKLVPLAPKTKRVFGALRGKIAIGPEFFEPLPPEELDPWMQAPDEK